jgi:hypothetical protein
VEGRKTSVHFEVVFEIALYKPLVVMIIDKIVYK